MTQLYPPATAADTIHAKASAAKRLRSNGDMYTGSFDPFVAAYTAAACACEKHRVMLTRILFCTDISAARRPSWVHGYLIYAFGIQPNISWPWASISSAVYQDLQTPQSKPQRLPQMVKCSARSSCIRLFLLAELNWWPDARRFECRGFWRQARDWWSAHQQTRSSLNPEGLSGSPPSTRSFVLGRFVSMLLTSTKPFLLVRPERNRPVGKDKLQYPAKSSVRMSSSSTPAPTSISLIPATMAGGPAL